MDDHGGATQAPLQLRVAFCLIGAAVVIKPLTAFAGVIDADVSLAMFKFVLLMALPAIAIPLMLLVAMRQRKNWARWLFSLWAVYSSLMAALAIILDRHSQPLSVTLGSLGAGLCLSAVVLLFRRPSSSWFSPSGAGRSWR
jgi:hypothetical protein